jgi:hypothetical protein
MPISVPWRKGVTSLALLQTLHDSAGQPLSKLVADGLAAKQPRQVVEAAIKLKDVSRQCNIGLPAPLT